MNTKSENITFRGRELLAQPRLAEEAGVTVATVLRWRKYPAFPKEVQIGGRVYFDALDFRAWIDAGSPKGEATAEAQG